MRYLPSFALLELNSPTTFWLLIGSCLIGIAKTGIHGAGMLAIPLLALVYGGKASTGLILPTLVMADILAVLYYRRHANWHILWRLFPWAGAGVLLGTGLGNLIDDAAFARFMAVIIFVSLALMIALEHLKKERIPQVWWFTASMGLIGGFTTMVGNLAGPVMALYLASARLPKNEYIGTSAWFFLVVNVFKVPFHVLFWGTINPQTLILNLLGFPFVALGAVVGIWAVKRFNERGYRWLIIVTTALAALMMLLG